MNFVSYIAILVVALAVVNAARISPFSKDGGVNSKDGKSFLSEWINMSVKSEPIVKVPIGGRLELECEAVGSPPPILKWFHRESHYLDPVELQAGFPEQNEIFNSAIGKVKSRMVVDCVMPRHQGIYTCAGTSGTKRKTPPAVTVVVEENSDMPNFQCAKNKPTVPRIVTWSQTLLEFSDRDVLLPCQAVGTPTPEMYWISNKNQIIELETGTAHIKMLGTGDLLISSLSWEDMGTYTCVVRNAYGEDKIETFVYPVKKEE